MVFIRWSELLIIAICRATLSNAQISDTLYGQMPELFYLDNYDYCMLRGEKALFCTFTFTLASLGNSSTFLWDIIKNVSANPQNYRHDQLRHGICVPQTCVEDYRDDVHIDGLINKCYNRKYRGRGLRGTVSDVLCQSNVSTYSIDAYDIAFGSTLLLYLIFVIFSSFYERLVVNSNKLHLYERTPSKVHTFIAAFSLPKNWYRLRATNTNPDNHKLRAIQGVRFYNLICVIMAHTVMGTLGGPVSNPQYTENTTKQVLSMFLANGWYVVQTFFVISGWLLSYHYFDMIGDSKPLKFVHIFGAIFNRYIRLIPALAVMVGIHSTWLVHAFRGPYWDMFVGKEYRNCRKNGWTNLLFVNNYIDSHNMCLHQTWYLAADMQLFILSILVLYVTSKFPNRRKIIFGSMLVIGTILPGALAYINKYDIILREYPEILYDLRIMQLDAWKLYSSGYGNIFGYCIGMIFGYLFYKYRNTCLTVKKVHIVLWWILTFGMCITVVLIAVVFYDPNFEVTRLKSAIYWASGKNLFALGVAIGLFGFTQKIGWFVRWACEFQPLQVLGRLTYSTYIIHVTFIRWQAGYRRYPISANDAIMFFAVIGDVACSYLAGTLLCLFVEMPISALQKMICCSSRQKRCAVKKSSEKSLETLDLTNDNPS
ncbi:O-acyltransferase like protein-like [Euwallacea fornicatus]|uniref:O-acyltransferase like protein-like n=1 Tax=Euwallacea fornicatus TaxID=995702 RepID=UPI00338D9459